MEMLSHIKVKYYEAHRFDIVSKVLFMYVRFDQIPQRFIILQIQ